MWLMLLPACKSDREPPIQIIVGSDETQKTRFSPESSFAEYIELPDGGSELRLTFANYSTDCERFVPPGENELLVVVVIVAPSNSKLGSGTYAWAGHAAHGGTATTPKKPYAAPSVRWGSRSYRIQPGGTIKLTSLELRPQGSIKGTLAFEFPGDGGNPATSIAGGFDAQLCRLGLHKP